nr:filamin-A-interacting protein 1-like [Aedes albopictus]
MDEHSQMKTSQTQDGKQDGLPRVVPVVECQPSTSKGLTAANVRPGVPAFVITSDTSVSEADDSLFEDSRNTSNPFYYRLTAEELRKRSAVKEGHWQETSLESNHGNMTNREKTTSEPRSKDLQRSQSLEEPAQASSTPYSASNNCSVETTNEADLAMNVSESTNLKEHDSLFDVQRELVAILEAGNEKLKHVIATERQAMQTLEQKTARKEMECAKATESIDLEEHHEAIAILQEGNEMLKQVMAAEEQAMQTLEQKTALSPKESYDRKDQNDTSGYQRETISNLQAAIENLKQVVAASTTPGSVSNISSVEATNETELTTDPWFSVRNIPQPVKTMEGTDRKERDDNDQREAIARLQAENEKFRQAVAEVKMQAMQTIEQKIALANTLKEIKEAVQTERSASLAVIDELNKRVSDRESIIRNQARLMEHSERKIHEKDKECEDKIKIYLDEVSRLKAELCALKELAVKNRDTIEQQAREIEAKDVLLVTSVDKWKSLTEQVELMREKINQAAESAPEDVPSSPEGQSTDVVSDIVCPICNEHRQTWTDMKKHIEVCVGADQLDVM